MKKVEQLNLSESLNSLTLWMKHGFEGMQKEHLQSLLTQVQMKIDDWQEPSTEIDLLYKNLAETIILEVGKIVIAEGMEGAIAARY